MKIDKHFSRGRGLTRLAVLLAMGLLGSVAIAENNKQLLTERQSVMSRKAHESLLTDAVAVGNKIVVVGERGHILVSTDNGRSWKQGRVPTQSLLTGVHFPTPELGWAVGHEKLILNSRDGGASWEVQYADPLVWGSDNEHATISTGQPLLDVWFRTATEGFAVGAYGTFLYTDDAGQNWQDWSTRIDNPDEWHLNAIGASADGNTLYIGGESGYLFRSRDGGQTWETLESPYEGSFFGFTVGPGADDALVFGLQGHVFRTRDAGDSWEEVETGNQNGLMAGVLFGRANYVLVGSGGVMLSSRDGGDTFNVQVVDDRQSLVGIAVTPGKQLVIVGKSGVKIANPQF
jgi:photosystem II stability/assembly factor-like uncharacterized protein